MHRPDGAVSPGRRDAGDGTACQPLSRRAALQPARLGLPLFPTTTIGSFPQTAEVRRARAAPRAGEIERGRLRANLREGIDDAVRWQEEIGLDVLVHGEFERNDMVKYFGEQLGGFAFTKHGWVQSLWQPLRAPADHLGRRLAPEADDGATGRLCAVAHRSGQ